jgi:hypothetical protein
MSNPMNPDQDKNMLDKAKEMAGGLRDKVGDFFDGDDENAESTIDKVGNTVDERTGDRFGDQIDSAQDAARGAADRLRDENQ